MHWTRVDQRWQARKDLEPGQELEPGVTFDIEQWTVPGEDTPLPVRVCNRKGFPLSAYTNSLALSATSITLHETCGYGNFAGMMGGNDPAHPTKVNAHFMIGRDGNAYLLVPIDRVAWHANAWSTHSVGIEIDNIGGLHEVKGNLCSEYGNTDVYCAKSDAGCFVESHFQGTKYWATWTDGQYDCTARLIKAICHKLSIPRYIQDQANLFLPLTRYSKAKQLQFRGVMTHYQVNPKNRSDIGPYIDWARLIHSAGLTEGDCFNTPDYSDELSGPGAGAASSSSSSDAA
jgi:hypothetical protein